MTRIYLQEWECMDGQWERLDGDFANALEALEKRDALQANAPNDGVERGWRVVDDAGNVLEYGKREVSN